MKILLIDQNGIQKQSRKMLLEEAISHTAIDLAATLDEVRSAYQAGVYDVIIVDNTIPEGQECIDYILSLDPQQQILVVSNSDGCVIRRCGDCVANHRIRRFNNPTPIKNIVRMLKGFEHYSCDHYDEETNKL